LYGFAPTISAKRIEIKTLEHLHKVLLAAQAIAWVGPLLQNKSRWCVHHEWNTSGLVSERAGNYGTANLSWVSISPTFLYQGSQ
jgi:hypothetical protein